jgi:hypothetical protein
MSFGCDGQTCQQNTADVTICDEWTGKLGTSRCLQSYMHISRSITLAVALVHRNGQVSIKCPSSLHICRCSILQTNSLSPFAVLVHILQPQRSLLRDFTVSSRIRNWSHRVSEKLLFCQCGKHCIQLQGLESFILCG